MNIQLLFVHCAPAVLERLSFFFKSSASRECLRPAALDNVNSADSVVTTTELRTLFSAEISVSEILEELNVSLIGRMTGAPLVVDRLVTSQ